MMAMMAVKGCYGKSRNCVYLVDWLDGWTKRKDYDFYMMINGGKSQVMKKLRNGDQSRQTDRLGFSR